MNFAPFWESCRADRPALPVGSSGSALRRVCAPGPASVRFPVHSRRPSGAFLRRNKRERPIALPRDCRKPPGLIRGRSPYVPSGSDDRCVRTDENPLVFVRCRFCRPGANARGKTCESSKKWRSATFSTLWRERPIALPHPPRDVPLFGRIRTAETFAAIAGVAVAVRANLDAFKIALAAVLVKAATCYATADGLFSTFAIHNLFTPPSLIESACSRQLVYPARPCLCAGGRILLRKQHSALSDRKSISQMDFSGGRGWNFSLPVVY